MSADTREDTRELLELSETSVNDTLDTAHITNKQQVVQDHLSFDLIFNTKNVYFLVFVGLSVIVFVLATVFRHHQQKKHQRKKEHEFLRYYHSVLPHSRIYGNLNEMFATDTKSSSKLRRKNSQKGNRKQERGSFIKEKLMAAMYKKYPYNPYVSEMEGPLPSEDIISQTGLDIIIENNDEAETRSNPELKIHVTKKKVTWRKYSFPNMSTNI